jgi:hypothetical protein
MKSPKQIARAILDAIRAVGAEITLSGELSFHQEDKSLEENGIVFQGWHCDNESEEGKETKCTRDPM